MDVDRIAKEMDFQALQQNIMNVTFCNIETEVKQLINDTLLVIATYLLHRNFITLILTS